MKTFIFDLDDTLIYNSYHYIQPYLKMCDVILKKIDPEHKELENLEKMLKFKRTEILDESFDSFFEKHNKSPLLTSIFKSIENLDVKYTESLVKEGKPPFSCDRLPKIFEDSLTYLCKKHDLSYSEKEEQQVRNIAKETFFVVEEFRPGAEEVLDFLKSKGNELILLTHGDQDWQDRKVKAHNLNDWFDEINIVDHKTYKITENIVKNKDKNKVYMVGNSRRSDINPALKAGINAIYVPFETWAFEKTEVSEESKIITFSNLSEIKKNYNKL